MSARAALGILALDVAIVAGLTFAGWRLMWRQASRVRMAGAR